MKIFLSSLLLTFQSSHQIQYSKLSSSSLRLDEQDEQKALITKDLKLKDIKCVSPISIQTSRLRNRFVITESDRERKENESFQDSSS